MNFDEIQRRSREIFRLEAADLLRELEAALLALEGDSQDAALIDRVFRVMHTLKGSGATSGFQELSDFLHHVEDVFNAARERRVQINSAMIDLTLKISDVVARHLEAKAEDATAVLKNAEGILTALLEYLPKTPTSAVSGADRVTASSKKTFRVKFRPHRQIFCRGSDPGMFLDDLRALGQCEVQGLIDELPELAKLEPEACYLRWEIKLTTEADEDAVRSVFMFVEDDCDLTIEPVALEKARASQPSEKRDTQGTAARLWYIEFCTTPETLVSPGALEGLWRELAKLGTHQVVSKPIQSDGFTPPGVWRICLETPADAESIRDAFIFLVDAQPKMSSEPFAQEAATVVRGPAAAKAKSPPAERAVVAKSGAAGRNGNLGGETLRVSSERLDKLVNLVGELVILRSQVSNVCATMTEVPIELQSVSEALQSLSAEMRDVILNIRMMPIEETFSKFRRLVRDLSRELGKEVDLVIEGAETEMDKTMLDVLNDPLMHLVRNSLDHGLETPDVRVAAGKPSRGILRLRAEQRGDRVVVTVADDGRGLDREKIRAKAIARGLLAPDARPTDSELFQIIFLPGFSTNEIVSKLSGRGVGLDVVRRQIERLRGKVEIKSEIGRGAEFSLSLPLTLAIIEGLMVEVDGDRYILPLSNARETIEISRSQRMAGNGRNIVELRGELVPYVRLREVFAIESESPESERVVVVELENHQRLGLCVDRVLGNYQTVLKSLGWLGRRAQVFSGATVLGDGRVALILDLSALLARTAEKNVVGQGLEI